MKSNVLKLALFATGLSGIVAEYVLSTLATYFLGDSVFQWTMIVSIMLFSMGLGSRISKYYETALLQKFIAIEFSLSILVAFVSVITYSSTLVFEFTGVIIYTLSIVVGILIGMEIPLVIRLNDQFESLRVNVSSMMENDYYGSLAGGVFFAFVGLPLLGLTYTPFILGTINFLVALSLVVIVWPDLPVKLKRQITAASFFVSTLLMAGVITAGPIIRFGEERRYTDRVIYSEQSKYQKIVITQSNEHFWLFIDGYQQLSSIDEVMYHEPLVHPVMGLSAQPRNILVMGGGDGGAVREILKYPSVRSIDLVDLDPAMTNLGREHPWLRLMNENAMHSPLLKIHNIDAFLYLEQDENYYDVIIIDLPDPRTIELNRLYSFEFYKLCYNRLRPQGLIITQAGSPYYAPMAFNCIEKTLKASGFTTVPLHNQLVTLGEWGWMMGAKSGKHDVLKQRLQDLSFEAINTTWVNNDAMTLMTSFGHPIFPFDSSNVEVNKIHHPVLYQYYLKGHWDLY